MAPGAIVSQPDGGQIRGSDAAEPGRVVPWQGQQQGTGQTPQPGQANQQAQQPQLPAQPAGGQLPGRIDTSPGSGTVTSTPGSAGQQTQQPGTSAPGTPPVISAPSGALQGNQSNVTTPATPQGGFGSTLPPQTGDRPRGGFGSSETGAAPPMQPVAPGEIDVTRRTQQMAEETLNAQPAGGTIPPAPPQQQQQENQPADQQQQNRPSIPMPPSNTGGQQ